MTDNIISSFKCKTKFESVSLQTQNYLNVKTKL